MSRMKFNCKNIYSGAVFYDEYAEEFSELRERMMELSKEIEAAWQGEDSKIYLNKYNNYIEYLKSVTIFLENKSKLLKNAAIIHNDIDNELCEQFKRSKFDE